ncbi:RHS repeat-associated core domain-containing protein [Catenulispora sp. EB89]|uniref:RHS repeat-associated core domain-containing protein n=1 Tax=Catenulispora sp. EB89 TaxID=3156257 RepID=UPI003513E1DB
MSSPSNGATPAPPKSKSTLVKYKGKARTLDSTVAGAAWKPSPIKTPPRPKTLALTATGFPAAATADVAVAAHASTMATQDSNAASPSLVQAAGTPVLIGAPASQAARSAASAAGLGADATAVVAPAKVTVSVADHAAATAAGISGVVVSLTRSDGQTGPASVAVGLDYSTFARAFGGDLPDRLQLVALPSCALTTPKVAACRTQTSVKFVNDGAGKKLTATVTLPGAASPAAASSSSSSAAPKAQAMVLAATSTPAGSTGSYSATSLSASNSWGEGGDTGSFTYSYPIVTPPSLSGAGPSVALSYDSGSVDGKTAVENSQPSWIGDGWDYGPGYIERTYTPCAKAMPTAFPTSADNCFARDKNGNLLPALTMSFGSHGGQLVPLNSSNTSFALPTDDGTRVDVLYGQINNGTRTGEFYRVRSPDGSVAFFGAMILPDSSAITAAPGSTVPGSSGLTDGSTWIEPVFNDAASSGCQDPTKVTNPQPAGSNCMQAWRWNVDYVIDAHTNVTRYSYIPETNYYGFGTAKAPMWYERGGVLKEIDYGFQLADLQGGATPTPAASVAFNTATRCVDPNTDGVYASTYGEGAPGCGGASFDTIASASMVDTPVDLNCPSTGTANNQCQIQSPSFWTSRRLASIVTQVDVNGNLQPVDHWDLFNQFHTLDTANSPMWLAAIRRCAASAVGNNGLCPAANGTANQPVLPDVQFIPQVLAQRVPGVTGTNVPANLPAYQRERIAEIFDELGATTAVTYDDPTLNPSTGKSNYAPLGCTAPPATTPDWHNTQLCYPEYWTAPGTSGPFTDWFQKYVVTGISTQDNTHAQNAPAAVTTATYVYGSSSSSIYNTPTANGAGVAWHSNDSELLTDPNSRTYDQYRGFAVVTVTTGSSTDAPGHPQAQSITTYLRGMDQDPDKAAAAAGSCTSGTLTVVKDCTPFNFTDDLSGVATRDDNALAGTVFETQTVDTVGKNVYSTVATVPWMSTPVAQHTRVSPLPTLRSFQLGTARSITQMPLAAGGNQVTENRYWHEQSLGGAVIASDTLPANDADGSAEVCTTTGYAAPDPSKSWMTSYTNRTTTTSAPCAYASPVYSGEPPAAQATGAVLSATRSYYDNGGTWPTTVVNGNVTRTDAQVDNAPTWQKRSTNGFDGYGRTAWTTDAAGSKTTTSYNPSTGALPTDVTVTSPAPLAGGAGWVTKTLFDPTRSLPLSVTDPNGRVTNVSYDALGRTSAVWLPGRPYTPGGSSNPLPNSRFSYTVNGMPAGVTTATASATVAPSVVETDSLLEDGAYGVSTTLLDSLGRTRQTQATPPSDDHGRVVTDTTYDSVGRVEAVSGPYYDSTTSPSGSMWIPASQSAIPSQTQTWYDGLGRTTDSIVVASGAELWRTHTDYHGADRVDVTPPAGGARTSTLTNSRGKTIALYTYHAGAAFGATDLVDADALNYKYDPLGNLTEVDQRADNSGDVNKWTFGYDMLGRKTSAGDPDAGNSTYGYDLDGNLQTTTSAVGSAVQKSLFYTYDLQNRRTAEYAGTSTSGTEQASWSYDKVPALTAAQSLANPGSDTLGNVGRAAGSIRYSSSGQKYTESVGGFDASGNPLSSSVGIPNADGNGALAGTYTTTNHYTALGQLTRTDLPTGGDLQPDTVGNGYDVHGLLVGTTDSYADLLIDSAYSQFGEPERRVMGDYPNQIVQDTIYDQPTRRVTNSTVSQLAWTAPIDTTTYTYDPAGHITAAVDIQGKAASYNSTTGIASANVATDAQCYHYDYSGRLDAAWSDTGAVNTSLITVVNGQTQTTTTPLNGTDFGTVSYPGGAPGGSGQANTTTAPTTGGLGSCANIAPTQGVSSATWQIGGPQPYGQVFSYDGYTGNRIQEQDYNAAGAVTNTSKYNYNAPGANQPHVLNSVTHTAGSSPDQYQYDAAGNTTSRAVAGQPTQNLSWDAENRMSGDTDGSGAAASYLYDADGNQLIRRDVTTTTLYLGATELHLDLGHNTVTGDRYFTYPGAPTIVESGGASPHLSYEAGNLQGTASTTIDASPTTADQAVTARRAYTPFNTPRGTSQPNVFGTFLDDHTFLGKTTDGSTGLVDMGARKYDPTTGRFISIDPILESNSPQDIGGYVYGSNDPVNSTDPTGLDPGGMDCVTPAGAPIKCTAGGAPGTSNTDCWPTLQGCPGYVAPAPTSNKTSTKTSTKHASAVDTASKVLGPVPDGDTLAEYDLRYQPDGSGLDNQAEAFAQWYLQTQCGDPNLSGIESDQCKYAQQMANANRGSSGGLIDGLLESAAIAFAVVETAEAVSTCTGEEGDPADCANQGAASFCSVVGMVGGDCSAAGAPPEVTVGPECNSFTASTPVLMADDKSEPIDDVKIGDEVEGTDTTSWAKGPHKVTALIRHSGPHKMVDVTLAGGATIQATDQHPFWDQTTHKFTYAIDLRLGDLLRTPDGQYVRVQATRTYEENLTAYNLTVDGVHTYYVVAGDAPVLVHNSSCVVDATGYAWAPDRADTSVLGPGQAWSPSQGTPVLGRQADTAIGGTIPGYTHLDIPDWDPEKNDAWVQTIIDQRGTAYTGTSTESYWNSDRNEPTVYAREVQQFLQAGYTWSGNYLVPPSP